MNNKRLSDIEIEIMRYAAGGMTGNKTYHQVRDQFMPMDSESMGYANGGGIGTMMKPKSKTGKAVNQLQAKAPEGEFLAYINPDEAAMLKRAGGSGEPVNGIPSFRPQDMGNAANQAASSRNTGMGGMGAGRTDGGDNSRGGNAPTGNDFRRSQREFIQKVNNDNAIRANQAGTKFTPYGGGSRPQGGIFSNFNPMSLLSGLVTKNPFGILASLFGKGFKGIKGFNDKIQNSDFGRSKTLADYFDAKKYGGIDARNLAAQKNMDEAAAITARLEGNNVKANVIGPNGQPITGGMAPNDFEIGDPSQYGLNSNAINEFATSPQFNTSLIDEFGDNRNINMDEFATQNNIDNRLMQEYLTDQASFQQPITASQIDEFGDNRNINMNEFAGNDIQMQNYLTDQANYNADPFGNPNRDPRVVSEEYGLVGNNTLPANDIFAGLTEKQKSLLDQRKGFYPDTFGGQEMLNFIESENNPDDPATIKDVTTYLG